MHTECDVHRDAAMESWARIDKSLVRANLARSYLAEQGVEVARKAFVVASDPQWAYNGNTMARFKGKTLKEDFLKEFERLPSRVRRGRKRGSVELWWRRPASRRQSDPTPGTRGKLWITICDNRIIRRTKIINYNKIIWRVRTTEAAAAGRPLSVNGYWRQVALNKVSLPKRNRNASYCFMITIGSRTKSRLTIQ